MCEIRFISPSLYKWPFFGRTVKKHDSPKVMCVTVSNALFQAFFAEMKTAPAKGTEKISVIV